MQMNEKLSDRTDVHTVVRGQMLGGIHLTSNFYNEQVINQFIRSIFLFLKFSICFQLASAVGDGEQRGQDPH